jgi:hypothetical protein
VAIIDSKHTPDFHTPRSQTSESLFAESYDANAATGHISSSPAPASGTHGDTDIKLKAISSSSKSKKPKNNKMKPEKASSSSKAAIASSKPITNENLNKIAAKLAHENRKKENLINPIEDSAADADDETITSKGGNSSSGEPPFHSAVNNSETLQTTKTLTPDELKNTNEEN